MGTLSSQKTFTGRALGGLMTRLRRTFPSLDKRLPRLFQQLGFGALPAPPAYFEDGLCSLHDHSFVADERFERAYRRGVEASGGVDHALRWRAHIFLWTAAQAAALPGDFVECGVNTGFLSSAMLDYLDWSQRAKTLYLLDTFSGPVESLYSDAEREQGRWEHAREALAAGAYQTNLNSIRKNFNQWERVQIIPGPVPETLPRVGAERLAFLHLDMNCTAPEIAALEHFWPRLAPGGFVLSDDYAGRGFDELRLAYDRTAAKWGVRFLALPTGQGLLQKPLQ